MWHNDCWLHKGYYWHDVKTATSKQIQFANEKIQWLRLHFFKLDPINLSLLFSVNNWKKLRSQNIFVNPVKKLEKQIWETESEEGISFWIRKQNISHFLFHSAEKVKKEISSIGWFINQSFSSAELKEMNNFNPFLYKLPFQKMCQLPLILSILKKISCSIHVNLISSQQNRTAPLKSCLIFYDYETLLTEIYRGSQIKFSLK